MATPDALAEAAITINGGSPAPPRVTLLSLPDELITQILRQVHAMYMHKKRNMPPTSYLCLNKRLSTLAQPIWLSVLCAPQDKTKAEPFFLGMIGMQDRLFHVRELEWTVHKAYPAYRLALVKSLRNLTTMHMRAINTVAGSVEGTECYYPGLVTRRLECTPSDLKGHSIIFSDLRLRLHQDEEAPQMRLYSLRNLEIVLGESIESNPNNFVASLLLQIDHDSPAEPCPSLTRLSLAFKHIAVFPRLWQTIYACCHSSTLSEIELHVPYNFSLSALDFDAWPNLERLALIYPLVPLTNVAYLCDFVLGLDNLKFFKLIGFDWRGDGSTDVLHEVPEGLLDYLWVPNLHFFLEVLRQSTEVLELRLRSDEDIDTSEYRWTPLTSEDDFEVESYDLA